MRRLGLLHALMPLVVLISTIGGSGVIETGFRLEQLPITKLARVENSPRDVVVREQITPALNTSVLNDSERSATPRAAAVEPAVQVRLEDLPATPVAGDALAAVRPAAQAFAGLHDATVQFGQVAEPVSVQALAEPYATVFLAVREAERGQRPAHEAARCFRSADGSFDAAIFSSAHDGGRLQHAISTATAVSGPATTDFGRALADAAIAQTKRFTIYNGRYFQISFPGGDIPELYGVCTDVVVRAYRALGIDLQLELRKARISAGGKEIAHRRTVNLRRFFSRAGANLPVSEFGEDYLPGDIVTYDRPQNAGSQHHIAVVTGIIGSSGDPMIVHNRGWGPQLEDSLFVDRITGHYRYRGPMGPAENNAEIAVVPHKPLPASRAQTPARVAAASGADASANRKSTR